MDWRNHFETPVLQRLQKFSNVSGKDDYGMSDPAWLISRVFLPKLRDEDPLTLENTAYFRDCQKNAAKNKEEVGLTENLGNPENGTSSSRPL